MQKHLISIIVAAAATLSLQAAPVNSVLDIKHSLTDDNVVPPESFETASRQLEENFYIQNFVVNDNRDGGQHLGSAKEYEKRLASLPTEIEMPYNSVVGNLIDMYLGRKRDLVSKMLALHGYYGNMFVEELIKEGLPIELQYLPVIESAINPNAVSRAGAAGLWQFMPATAKGLGMEINSLVDQRRDPQLSSRNAARYLRQLHDIYDDWSLAIAAYNCGPGNVNKALRRAGGGKKDFWEIYEYLPKETRGYLPAFIAANYVMNFYKKHNIAPTVVKQHLVTDTVQVNHRVHFNQIAEILNIPVEEIRMLNPQYVKDIIPGNYHPYTLTLPKQQVLSYIISEESILAHDADLYAQRTYVEPGVDAEESIPVDESGMRNLSAVDRQSANADDNMTLALATTDSEISTVTHTVSRGENLKDIAKRYGVSATDIKRWNKLRRGKVKEGDRLIIEQRAMAAPDQVTAQVITRPEVKGSDVPAPPKRETPKAPEVPERRQPAPADSAAAKEVPAKKTEPAKAETKKTETKKAEPKKAETKKPATPKTTSYTVKKGDTLTQIAKRNGVTVDQIKKANNMKGDNLQIGQKIKIPSKASSTGSGKKKSGKRRR